jgi:hypothetical protein
MSRRWKPREFFRVLWWTLRGRLVNRDSLGRWIIKSPSGKRAMLDDDVVQKMPLKGAAARYRKSQSDPIGDEPTERK